MPNETNQKRKRAIDSNSVVVVNHRYLPRFTPNKRYNVVSSFTRSDKKHYILVRNDDNNLVSVGCKFIKLVH